MKLKPRTYNGYICADNPAGFSALKLAITWWKLHKSIESKHIGLYALVMSAVGLSHISCAYAVIDDFGNLVEVSK